MNNANLSPLFVFLFYILRCLVPLGIMLGVSYLLRRLGWIRESPPPPPEWDEQDESDHTHIEGGLAHG